MTDIAILIEERGLKVTVMEKDRRLRR